MTMLQKLVNQIESDLAAPIDSVSLAASVHLSHWHFQRLFKSWVGDTLGGYLRGRRLTRAAESLLNTEQGILDIALAVGFQSHEAFTRSFKAYFGCTPRAFRERRPAVRLKDKPLLKPELMHHLALEMRREPEIIQRPALDLIGLSCPIPSPFTHPESHCDTMYPLWMELLARQEEIPHRWHDTYLGMSRSPSGDFTESRLFFLAAIPVSAVSTVPEGMVHYHLPAQCVAAFDVAVVDNDTVSKTMDYIYGYWLPNAPYVRDSGHDYEFFQDVQGFQAEKLSSRYVLPVLPRP
ncbi:MAG: AraC family transcriptional regulator [Candidatus Sericytochromatia bacterium]|nr:AraC family transcriptional regulator [Candidatus Sericytochromatia bacterium]